ncbi:MAG: L-lactate dehydrogenase [Tepidanaerobacteraceae bacterium]|nr:L-lactate dehydrogenase [Tepidanaerobacteraceae bacterium]
MKIGLVGTGYVGATTAYALLLQGIASEMVLIDANMDKAEGEALDLTHSTSFVHPVQIYAGDYCDLAGTEIVIISAGPSIGKNETRLDLAGKNYEIFKEIIPKIIKYNDRCILLIVTNPVDVLSYAAFRLSGFPKNRVIGSGTVLDSCRFRAALSAKLGVDARNIHGYILGEHGDSQVAAWSLTNVMGINFDEFCHSYIPGCRADIKKQIENEVRSSAYTVIEKKGATNYAIALAVAKIVKSILRDENSILTVSTYVEDLDGVLDVYLSLPCVVNKRGADRVLIPRLSNSEKADLKKSAKIIKEYIEDVMGAVV